MKTLTIEYIEVGRQRWSGTTSHKVTNTQAEDPDVIAMYAQKEARKHLMSRMVETEYHPKPNRGFIFTGWRQVGEFKVKSVE